MSNATKTLQKEEPKRPEVMERSASRKVFTPRADIYETPEAIVVLADMPGVDDGSVEITVEKNILTIDGHVEPFRPEGYRPAHTEYGIGDYHRAFTLSDEIAREGIHATMKGGVLRLTLPKAGPALARKIPVRAE
jgi:HSP20 family molecular chaperone IbpA